MIDFPCGRCGHAMSVPSDMAGEDIQCPECGLLLAVPLPSDLANVNADGTLRMAEAAPVSEPDRLATLARIYGRHRVDETGEEIDNRTLPEETELAPMPGPPRVVPKYDPETGELIAPVEVAPSAPVAALPAESLPPRVLGYRAKGVAVDEPKRVAPRQVKLELFQPMNLFVMTIVLVAHVLFNVGLFVVNAGIVFFAIAPLVLILLIVGHYGNVIDEIGPTDMDELPRPLRSLSWSDDLWGPFRDVFASLVLICLPLIAYGWIVLKFDLSAQVKMGLTIGAVVISGISAFFLPAILLAFHTSGTVFNARPDRILGLIARCGREYFPVAALGYLAVVLYGAGTFGTFYSLLRSMGLQSWRDFGWLGSAPVTYAILMVGIYLAHLFAWRVGLLYRNHQPQFPWINQVHVRKERDLSRAKRSEAKQVVSQAALQRAAALPRRQALVEGLQARDHI
jgi:hypothetical protein